MKQQNKLIDGYVSEVEKDKEISELKAEIKKLITNLKKMEKEFDSK